MANSSPAVAAAAATAGQAAAAESAPRKRRRRAPATGASVDCFACQESHTACDRRRPYCTQCIERGKTCSGYKTQLTWGVGVASRGKLRGLSLPVAAAKKSTETVDLAKSKASAATSPSIPAPNPPNPPPKVEPSATAASVESPTTKPAPRPSPQSELFEFGAPHNATSPHTQPQPQFTYTTTETAPTPVSAPPPPPPHPRKPPRRHSLQPLQMPPPSVSSMLGPVPMSANVYSGFQFGSLDSAVESPPTPYGPFHDPAGFEKSFPIPGSYGRFPDGYRSGYSSSSWRSDTMSSGLSSNTSSHDLGEDDPLATEVVGAGIATSSPHEAPPRVSYHVPYNEFIPLEEVDEVVDGSYGAQIYSDITPAQLSLVANSTLQSQHVGKTTNLRELIHYYDQVVTPVILAFDGPKNPWRHHIIRLAGNSDALQHAIAALAASNLRTRRDGPPPGPVESNLLLESTDSHDETVRKSSIAHSMLVGQVDQPMEYGQQRNLNDREVYHKGEAIRALNNELYQLHVNPYASDETVLATLLILCLYHICDTGVAKFRNQFAVVKKLMALRKRRAKSQDSNWLLLMFKWFDAITATVNDREGQFEEFMAEESTDEWALENLAGCDGRLFPIMSRLGRLNMLSQGKSVTDGASTPRAQPPRPSPVYFGIPHIHNGYLGTQQLPENPLETHPQFAVEWYALHQALHDLQFDQTSNPLSMQSTTPATDQDSEIIDLRHISESFRYSMLLYLERIAHPRQPSSAPNFCQLVDEAIYHIAEVKSDVYLLWPLFITGNECVLEGHRDLIRRRCRSIQRDSGFYNNTSTLGLLEKAWEEKDRGYISAEVPGPFEWRKNMQIGEEEYIVI